MTDRPLLDVIREIVFEHDQYDPEFPCELFHRLPEVIAALEELERVRDRLDPIDPRVLGDIPGFDQRLGAICGPLDDSGCQHDRERTFARTPAGRLALICRACKVGVWDPGPGDGLHAGDFLMIGPTRED